MYTYLTESPGDELLTRFLSLRHLILLFWLFVQYSFTVNSLPNRSFNKLVPAAVTGCSLYYHEVFAIQSYDTESQLMAITIINNHLLFDFIHLLFMIKMSVIKHYDSRQR